MKKFKLIKEYPNSCSLGTIFTEELKDSYYAQDNSSKHGAVLKRYSSNWKTDYFTKNPEYYEEIIEKDYEILSFKDPLGNSFIYRNSTDWDKEFFNNPNYYKIHSIKRLSDGEVFTIGDKLYGYDLGRAVGLTMFKLYKDKCLVGHRDLGLIEIKNCKKAKTPLFTTEDGVEIFKGDKYWRVSPEFGTPMEEGRPTFHLSFSHWKFFSTKEAAEEYVNLMKPYLSNNDVLLAIKDLKSKEKIIEYFINKVAK